VIFLTVMVLEFLTLRLRAKAIWWYDHSISDMITSLMG
jgi:hypothetical protein